MFFAYKSLGVGILVVLAILAGTFNLIQGQSSADVVIQSGETARFAVIGDFGKAGQEELDVANLVKSWNPDFIVTTGDNNYMIGEASTIDENIGQYYHEFIHPYNGSYGAGATTNRFFPSMGNHDWDTSNAQPYLNYFTLPGNERYYDFVWGPIHFFVLDSDVREPDGNTSTSSQAAWLQTKLATSTSAWQVVVLHHPPFSSGSTHGSSPDLQWPYAAWGADVVLAGHDHLYERLFRDGIPYFVTGSSGYPILYPFGAPIAGSLVRYNINHGALLVEATTSEMNFSFITRTGSLIDNYKLTNGNIDPSKLHFEPVVSGLSQPVFITHAGDNSGRLFILERAGMIRIVKNGTLLSTPFLNIQSIVNSTGSEQGLLALAFHPQFETNGYFYTVHTNSSGAVVLSRFTASPSNTDQVDAGSRVELLPIPHPMYANHNGGTLAFGPDGYLYWSTGDGGGTGDPFDNAQDLTSLLGKILRLDVNSASPYGIPSANPFYTHPNSSVRKEIWAYGLRNPWRFSFDSLTNDIYIGDVGQSNIEEINFQAAGSSGGENYGWDIMEGSSCYDPSSGCNTSGKILPIAQYTHSLGCSVTGGHVYRGSNYPSLFGHYFYGDYCTGRLFSIYKNPQLGWQPAVELDDTSFRISSFGEDEQRELYLADYSTGILYNIHYQEPVTISGNVGQAGVTLSYTDGTPKTVTSSTNGNYSLSVPYNWSGTVTPSHTCFTFNPPNRPYSNVVTNQVSQNYTAIFNPASNCAEVNVLIAGSNVGHLIVPSGSSLREGYPGLDNGLVQIHSTNSANILSALRVIWKEPGYRSSYSEMMGLPAEQLSSEYWFPWYNNGVPASMDQGFRIANVDPVSGNTVEVWVGSVRLDMIPLAAGESVRVGYNVDNGPIRVVCTTCTNTGTDKIIAALRVIWKEPGYRSSYSEMMGLPVEQLSSEYWFPWYNNAVPTSMDQGFRIANVDPSSFNTVEVWVGDTKLDTISLAGGASTRVGYNVDNGPIRVVCTTCTNTGTDKIIAALRVIWKEPGFRSSYSEMMGLPKEQLSTEYWFPWYNNIDIVSMDQGFRIANVDTSAHAVRVFMGTMQVGNDINLAAGASTRVGYSVNNGPIRIVCVDCMSSQKIIAALRVIWQEPGQRTSYSEMMGLPVEQLSTEYWFPWYNFAAPTSMDQGFRIAVP